MVVVAVGLDLRILISILACNRGLLKIAFFFSNNIISYFSLLTYFYNLLTTFGRMSGRVDIKKICICIWFIQRFSGFPYLLRFWRVSALSGWVDQNFFFRISLIYHFTRFSYLLTTFFIGCQAELTSKIVFLYLV